MLGLMRRAQRWILWGVIVLVGGVFVFYLGLGGPPAGALPPTTVLDVDGRRYTVRDVYRVRRAQEESYREALGDDFDASGASQLLDQLAVTSLESHALMAVAAERAGLRASDAEVRALVRQVPGVVDEEGRLDTVWLRSRAEQEYGSELRFVEALRDSLLQEKLTRLLRAAVSVSPAEARESLRLRREEIRIAYVVLDPSSPALQPDVPEEEVARLLADEERLRDFYDEHLERYHQPERVRARHILLRVEPDASEETIAEIRTKAEALRERLAAGEDFAALAKEHSEDPGTKEAGGDLGFFTRGQMTPAFEEAAFALEPGTLSEPVRSEFGYHLIRVEERRPAEDRSFEQVKEAIAREIATREAARERARTLAERVAEAVRAGQTLEEAARAEGLTLERPDWIRRNPNGVVPGLGAAPELLATAFALPDDRPSSERIFEVDGRWVLVQRLERRSPDPEELEAEVEAERERLLEQRLARARELWIGGTRAKLQREGRLTRNLSNLERL